MHWRFFFVFIITICMYCKLLVLDEDIHNIYHCFITCVLIIIDVLSLNLDESILHLVHIPKFALTFLVIEEKGVKMKLTVIDTPGFGDQINNENWWVFKWGQQNGQSIGNTEDISVQYYLVLANAYVQPIKPNQGADLLKILRSSIRKVFLVGHFPTLNRCTLHLCIRSECYAVRNSEF